MRDCLDSLFSRSKLPVARSFQISSGASKTLRVLCEIIRFCSHCNTTQTDHRALETLLCERGKASAPRGSTLAQPRNRQNPGGIAA